MRRKVRLIRDIVVCGLERLGFVENDGVYRRLDESIIVGSYGACLRDGENDVGLLRQALNEGLSK